MRTVIEKKSKTLTGILEDDQRGKHKNRPTVDLEVSNEIKEHINSIPRIESHYTRADSSRVYIDEIKSLTQIHRDYVEIGQENNRPFGNYTLFHRIFTEQYNISFFTPKKDLFYENANDLQKEKLKESYDKHHE